MSQSFEKKVGSRLQHYEPAPPPHLKKKVFAAVSPSGGINGWQVTGVIFILSALMQFFIDDMPGSSMEIAESVAIQSQEEVAMIAAPEYLVAKPKDEVVAEKAVQEKISTSKRIAVAVKDQDSENHHEELNSAIDFDDDSDSNQGGIAAVLDQDRYLYGMIDPRSRPLEPTVPVAGSITFWRDERKMIMLNKEIVPVKSTPPFYVESGLFFLYQQVVPNFEDDLIIESFEGQPGLSIKRLGIHVESGIYKRITRKIRVHAGVKASTYQQAYSFVLRNSRADDVDITSIGEEVVFSPIYESDKVHVNHRLYTAGGRLTANFQVFPSSTTELLIDSEFQKVLNSSQSFDFDGKTYQIGYRDQWTFAFGMRKTFWLSQKGMVQAVPTVRYSFHEISATGNQAFSFKPYSVGVSISYIFGNFMKQ